tara:strand:- start:1225 stop:2229 length:1005 start_codon:yes stop_codon:yes gene_type:complete
MFDLDKPSSFEAEELQFDYKKYIVNPNTINGEINNFFSGNIKKGYTLGIPEFDNHFVCKENELYALTGRKGEGKTTISQAIQIMHSIVNDLIWVVAFQENADWGTKINYMNYLLSEHPKDVEKNNPELYKKASDWLDKHFIFLDVEDIKTAVEVTKELINNGTNVHALVLDPVNSFKSGYQDTGNGYSDGVETARAVLKFTADYCTVYVSQHPNMSAQRLDRVLTPYDAEGGWWNNKASFTWIIHRQKDSNHNNVIVYNVRNKHTGGSPTKDENNLIIDWQVTQVNIFMESGGMRHENVIQKLVKKHNPLKLDDVGFIKDKELPVATLNDAFDF